MENLDESIGAFVRGLRSEALNPVVIFITNMGRWTTIVGIGVCIIIADLIWMKKPDYPIAIGACLVNLGIYSILKPAIHRPRPLEKFWLIIEHGHSFPSGHTMNSVFCYGMMLYLILRNSDNENLKKVSCVFFPALALLRKKAAQASRCRGFPVHGSEQTGSSGHAASGNRCQTPD